MFSVYNELRAHQLENGAQASEKDVTMLMDELRRLQERVEEFEFGDTVSAVEALQSDLDMARAVGKAYGIPDTAFDYKSEKAKGDLEALICKNKVLREVRHNPHLVAGLIQVRPLRDCEVQAYVRGGGWLGAVKRGLTIADDGSLHCNPISAIKEEA